ncbi:peroxidase, FMP-type [Flavobacterium sp. Fl-77]|uniref:Peroxidase, FMP-type n=1 Tax=Flavobacterium flavipigmentatum TaxID=2893884 RepID=A0AAJ2SCV7_9FLAO|nr:MULTISPECIES: peroxidase, FMP-type [unclassified Flavobacterium]MDX6182780.1 peroxidase, FMP-type [Flavobacterium sp. Fl-33]MDX6186041.1 peroxidase, FMP-type [Flavobacterium sp. Fl-77]UFH38193.1 peroxidase, FMP-type [Flavobacterium sp. F-70]
MLKRNNSEDEVNLLRVNSNSDQNRNEAFLGDAPEDNKGVLESLMSGYSKVQIEDPIRPFYEDNLQKIVNNVDYGILKVLQGTWVSYNNSEKSERKLIGTGIHTTIMPSPGTNAGTIPGKYSFECQEYIEKLTFDLVPGGVRNRGGANEQFCGAVKYDQSIKSVTSAEGQDALQYTPIHEENGMYLWLSDVFNYAATEKTIKEDRGVHAVSQDNPNKDLYKSGYQDETLFLIINDQGEKEYVTQENLNGRKYYEIIAAKELKVGAGQTGQYFIPDYSISRSGVIPHGSTITLLGDLVRNNLHEKDKKYLFDGPPPFPEGNAAWKYDHLSISRTMGGAGASETDPINLDKPAPDWVFEKLDDSNDPGENKIYTQRILADPLYPYSVRPDLRLRDTNKEDYIKNYVLIQMSSKNKTGAQGGILNVPFVNRFVPTVEMNMRMWLETVVEDEKEILQLQYEQVIFFEFDFGDDGGTTSWPHIQVNTLRKIEDVPLDQRRLIEEQFPDSKKIESAASASGCPYQKE